LSDPRLQLATSMRISSGIREARKILAASRTSVAV
jgi:hypothetical protein